MKIKAHSFLVLLLSFVVHPSFAQNVPATVRGGCIVIAARSGSGSSDLSTCDRIQNTNLSVYRGWAADFLLAAFDDAERSTCGTIRCAGGSRGVDLVILNSGFAWASVSFNAMSIQQSKQLTIFISTGLIDFVEAATTSYLVQSDDPANGLRAWLQRIDSHANSDCKWHVESPLHQVDQNTFRMVRASAHAVYKFILGHELAHVMAGGMCGQRGLSQLDGESACDRYSFEHEWSSGVGPNMVIVSLVAMAHYHSLLNERLGALISPSSGLAYSEIFPAADWRTRASRIADLWVEECQSDTTAPACKEPLWRQLLADARRYINTPLPADCNDSSRARTAENNKAGDLEGTLCGDVKTFTDAATTDFASLRGTARRSSDRPVWNTNVVFAKTASCKIFARDTYTGAFTVCRFTPATQDDATQSQYKNLSKQMASCLVGWKQSQKTSADEQRTDFYNGDKHAAVVLNTDDGVRTEVWFYAKD